MSLFKDQGAENRRRVERIPLLKQFYLSAVLPEKGPYRLNVVDINELGIGFAYESSEIDPASFKSGDVLALQLFLNQRLFLPLTIRVVHARPDGRIVRVGAEIMKLESEGYAALLAFLKMLDAIPPSVKDILSILR